MSDLPSVEQILELPVSMSREVPPEYLDENLHMNISHYLVLTSDAVIDRCAELGMGQSYIDDRRLTTFTAEHHIRYYNELRLGQKLSVHIRLLERSSKALHAMAFLLNRSSESLACTLEATLVHVGMDTRRPVDYPEDIAARLDTEIESTTGLNWVAPTCGAMGIRKK